MILRADSASATPSATTRVLAWRARNREHYNAYMREYRKRKRKEKREREDGATLR